MDFLQQKIDDLKRRILNYMVQGIITVVNDAEAIQKLQINLGSGYVRDNTLRIQEYGFTSNPPPGTFGVVLAAGGNITDAVIVACDNPKFRPTGLASGESQMYDNAGKYVYLSSAGIVIEANNMPVTVNHATVVTINAATEVLMTTPILKVSGDIIDNYGTNNHSMAQMRTLYNEHVHGGVQTGGGNTAIPDNEM